MAILEFALLAFTSIVVITEPSSTIPEFLALTKDLDASERHRAARKIRGGLLHRLGFFCFDRAPTLRCFKHYPRGFYDSWRNSFDERCLWNVSTQKRGAFFARTRRNRSYSFGFSVNRRTRSHHHSHSSHGSS